MRNAALLAIAALVFLALPAPRSADPPPTPKHRVPPGFVIEQVAGEGGGGGEFWKLTA